MKIRNNLFLFILLITASITAQLNHKLKFKRIGENFGLSNSWVKDIHQDKEGFIWFGTADGLNRFDGYECKVYIPKNDDNIAFGGVSLKDIETKSENELWIATNSGMYVFSDNKLNRYTTLPGVGCISVINQDNEITWIASTAGLIKLNTKEKKYRNLSKDKNHKVYNEKIISTFKDSKGNIWFGSTGCIFKYNIAKNEFKKIDTFQNIDTSTKNDIHSIVEDKTGRIWVGFGQNGLYYYQPDDNTNIFKKHSKGVIIDLLVDKENILWIARGSNQGLASINLNTGKQEVYLHDITNPNSISDNSVFSLFEDNQGDLWIGTYGSGVNYYSKRDKKIYNLQKGYGQNKLKSNLINSIVEDENYTWIGTEGGITRINKKTAEFKHYTYEEGNTKSLRRDPVFSIFIDSFNNLWVGVWDGGLHKYNYDTDDFTRYSFSDKKQGYNSDNTIAIHQDKKNRLWIGTVNGGLYKFNYKSNALESYFKSSTNPKGVPKKKINQIHSYNENEILLNTGSSIKLYNADTNTYKSYNLKTRLKTNPINIICSYIDHKNEIWIGSNIGLYKFDKKNEAFIPYSPDSALNNLPIQSIIEDNQNNIWVATNKGLFNIDERLNRITRLSKQDGLTSNDFKRRSVYKSKSGLLYFGSSKGLNYFNPKELILNEKAPNLAITSLSILKSQPNKNSKYEYVLENLNSNQEIILSENQSSFEISFTGLNYLDPEKNSYKYKLEGYDKVWVDSGNKRTATYTNLKAGDYTFKVTGTNNDGIKSTTIKEITITKQGPWYLSDWFKTIVAILLISLPFLFYFVRLSIFKKQRKKLKQKVAERTEELTKANLLLKKQTSRIQNQNKELSKHRNNLEALVANRTEELEFAKIKAEESDRLKSAFIANMSHEIRTPMNAIYGFSGLLGENDVSPEEQTEYVDIIKDSCESLLVLIDDILDISIMDAQGIPLNLQELNVDEFLNQLETVFKQQEKTKAPVSFTNTPLLHKTTIIKTDPIRLRQILNNLINNAIKFTEEGSIQFGYYVEDNQITFFVRDTGIGISKKDLSNIFKPFIKAGNNSAKIYRGTGIGLSISERIVKTFKGKIWVESQLGKGAQFYVKLPL